MLARHHREREELLRWDDAASSSSSLKRKPVSSTTTFRRDGSAELKADPMFIDGSVLYTEDEGDSTMGSGMPKWKGKGRLHDPTRSLDLSQLSLS
jgi:hypothetical protein